MTVTAPQSADLLSKVQMEERLEGAVVLRFPRIYGPGDKMILPQMLKLMREGQMVLVDGGSKLQSSVRVEDAARACVLAAERGVAGQTYHVTAGDRVTNKQVLDLIADAAGLPLVTRDVGLRTALMLAGAAEGAAGLFGRPPLARLTRFRVKYVGCHHHYAIEKARRDFRYESRVRIADGMPAVARVVAAGAARCMASRTVGG